MSTVQILLQSERLKIARALPEAQTLTAELLTFEAKITEAANDVYNARQGKHDDLVLALALACWYGADRPSAASLISFVSGGDVDRGYRRRFMWGDDDV